MSTRADYMRQYRLENPGYANRNARRVAAHSEALRELARRHPAEFAQLYDDALGRAEDTAVKKVSMERPCACGGTIRRTAPTGRWPARCDACRREPTSRTDASPPAEVAGLL